MRAGQPLHRIELPTAPTVRSHRIALLTHGLYQGGGVPAVTHWLCKELQAQSGYSVDIFDLATSRRDPYSRKLADPKTWFRRSMVHRDERNHVYTCGANAVELEYMRYRARRQLTRILDDYDLVQVVSGTPAWARVAVSGRTPVVVQAATTVKWERVAALKHLRFASRLWFQLMTSRTTKAEKIALLNADAVLVENSEMLEHVRRVGQYNVQIAPPGIDTNLFRPRENGRNKRGHLLSVCRLGDPRKALDRMVRAYRHIVDQEANTPRLVLAGRGILRNDVVALIDSLGLTSRVMIRTDVAPDEILALYREASVYLQTSTEEGLGISALQAMACGLPVVTTDTAGSREIVVDGTTGWIVPQDEFLVENFARKIGLALGTAGDTSGTEGRIRCEERFSSAATIRHFTRVYEKLVGDNNPEDEVEPMRQAGSVLCEVEKGAKDRCHGG